MMRLPLENGNIDMRKAVELIREYMRREVKYFDTHPSYIGGMSQEISRKLVVERYPRESYMLANKMSYYGLTEFQDYETIFGKELENCGVRYFDYYMLHALTKENYEMYMRLGGFSFLEKKKVL